jgi:hypothetical protein
VYNSAEKFSGAILADALQRRQLSHCENELISAGAPAISEELTSSVRAEIRIRGISAERSTRTRTFNRILPRRCLNYAILSVIGGGSLRRNLERI